jgi:hypothetical protein
MSRHGVSKVSVLACLLAIVVLTCLSGFIAPLELMFWLAVGWLPYLARVSREMRPDWNAVATGAGALAAFTLGLHLFLKWLSTATQRNSTKDGNEVVTLRTTSAWKPRWTAAIVAIIVMLFVAGTATIGMSHQTAWLLNSDQPLFNANLVREAASRAQSANNLRSLGIALNEFANRNSTYPPGATISDDGRALHSWQTALLPYMDQQPVYDKINLEVPWNDPSHQPAFATRIKDYLLPKAHLPNGDGNGYALSHYAANQLVLGGTARRKQDDFPDGASNTLLVGEAAGNFKPWGNPTNWRDPATGINSSPDGFGSPWSTRGAHFAFADGSTRFISDKTDPKILRALATPSGGESIGNYEPGH